MDTPAVLFNIVGFICRLAICKVAQLSQYPDYFLPGARFNDDNRGTQWITQIAGSARSPQLLQYFWRPQLSLKDSTGHVFIWTVQTLDSKGYPINATDSNNPGRSEPFVFGVCHTIHPGSENPGEECACSKKI